MGAGTPTIGGTLTGAVTEGSGAIVTGTAVDVGTNTGTTDDTWAVTVGAAHGMASVNPTTGVWSYDLNDADPALWKLGAGQQMTDVFTLRMTDADGRTDTKQVTITITGIACFLRGTRIDTADGPVAVEDLHPGQMILTADHGPRPLAWVGHSRLDDADLRQVPKANPVRIRAGAFGPGLPARDLLVSPQHRLCLRPPNGAGDAFLVPAVKLAHLDGVDHLTGLRRVDYFHLLFDRHEVVFAEGLACESLLLGPGALAHYPPRAVEEIRALFPRALRAGHGYSPARPLVERRGALMRMGVASVQGLGLGPGDFGHGAEGAATTLRRA